MKAVRVATPEKRSHLPLHPVVGKKDREPGAHRPVGMASSLWQERLHLEADQPQLSIKWM